MKAILYRRYGSPDVLEVADVERPNPGEGEVLVRVCAAAINPLDRHLMRGEPYPVRVMCGLRRPKDARLGRDLAGRVEAVGSGVQEFRPGDEVFGTSSGALAEYACASEKNLAPKPANLTFEQAAAVPVAALTALEGLRDKGRIQAGQKVLIHGASGGVGTFAVQIAKAFGAQVTGVCSARNVDLLGAIGADRIIDYTRKDFTREGQLYDLIFDCVGNRPLSACRRVLHPSGIYVAIGGPKGRWIGPLAPLLKALLWSPFVSQKLVLFLASAEKKDLVAVKGLLEAGRVRPVIDRCYRLSEAREALRYLEEGHARGKIVLVPDG